MLENDIYIDRQNMYRLFENEDGEKYVGVMCGCVAGYEMRIKLNDEEVLDYRKHGKTYLDKFAKDVALRPSLYEGRSF